MITFNGTKITIVEDLVIYRTDEIIAKDFTVECEICVIHTKYDWSADDMPTSETHMWPKLDMEHFAEQRKKFGLTADDFQLDEFDEYVFGDSHIMIFGEEGNEFRAVRLDCITSWTPISDYLDRLNELAKEFKKLSTE